MRPAVALPAAFWLVAYTGILLGLATTEARIRRADARRAWVGYGVLLGAGLVLCAWGPRLFARAGGDPFPFRVAWNSLCAIWLVQEWALLHYLLRLTSSASERFLSRPTIVIPAVTFAAVILAVFLSTAAYHARIPAPRRPLDEVERLAHLYVRLAGFAYIAVEAAIAAALWRAGRVLDALIARARS